MGFFGFLKKKPHETLKAPELPKHPPPEEDDLEGGLPPAGEIRPITPDTPPQPLDGPSQSEPPPAPDSLFADEETTQDVPISMHDQEPPGPPPEEKHHLPDFSAEDIAAAEQLALPKEPEDWTAGDEPAEAQEEVPDAAIEDAPGSASGNMAEKERADGQSEWTKDLGGSPPAHEMRPGERPKAVPEKPVSEEDGLAEEPGTDEPPMEEPQAESLRVREELPAFEETEVPETPAMESLYVNAVGYRDCLDHIKGFAKGVDVGTAAIERLTESMTEHNNEFGAFAEQLNGIEKELMRIDSVLAGR